ncbi:MAG: preprotein translocase subunit SecE [Armatimonadetes bacterium]|nr:preprotein translocase subunit SecE [Armatimonadota bacterium]MDE2207354.1 preprotein translocase subunit SecE [Armatimonadota bacterium]
MAAEKTTGAPGEPVRKQPNFFAEVITELKKTTWPTRQAANRLTMEVLMVLLVVGIYMGTLDWLCTQIVNRFQLLR